MVDVNEKCTGCVHHVTCKYAHEYEEQCSRLQQSYDEDTPIVMDISCKYFSAIIHPLSRIEDLSFSFNRDIAGGPLVVREKLVPYIISSSDTSDNEYQYIFKFNNGYGASVIKNAGSYGHHDGLWEMALIRFDENDNWELTYEHDFVDDVKGFLKNEEVNDLLEKIMKI